MLKIFLARLQPGSSNRAAGAEVAKSQSISTMSQRRSGAGPCQIPKSARPGRPVAAVAPAELPIQPSLQELTGQAESSSWRAPAN